jgi:hypothetical protein
VACPFFMPTEKYENGGWPHPARLPLGAGWKGLCQAPGFENSVPEDGPMQDLCNLGYASNCRWLPADRVWDSVRFGVSRDCEQRVVLCYACEKEHRPVAHGFLEYDLRSRAWSVTHSHPGIQRMAECFVDAYLLRKQASTFNSSENP